MNLNSVTSSTPSVDGKVLRSNIYTNGEMLNVKIYNKNPNYSQILSPNNTSKPKVKIKKDFISGSKSSTKVSQIDPRFNRITSSHSTPSPIGTDKFKNMILNKNNPHLFQSPFISDLPFDTPEQNKKAKKSSFNAITPSHNRAATAKTKKKFKKKNTVLFNDDLYPHFNTLGYKRRKVRNIDILSEFLAITLLALIISSAFIAVLILVGLGVAAQYYGFYLWFGSGPSSLVLLIFIAVLILAIPEITISISVFGYIHKKLRFDITQAFWDSKYRKCILLVFFAIFLVFMACIPLIRLATTIVSMFYVGFLYSDWVDY